jgi:hypothetical protein
MGMTGYCKISEWNDHFMLHTIPEKSMSQNMFNFSVSFNQENVKWYNINKISDIISENIV